MMEWEAGELLRVREYAHDSSLIQCNSQAREVRRVTRVTDAFRYELQKEVDTSRRRIFCHIHWAEVSFLPSYFDIVCAHIYSHTQLRSLTVDFLSQLSRTRTCVHFPFDSQPQMRPINCAPCHPIYMLSRSLTSLSKLPFTTFSPFGIPLLH